MGAFKHFFSMFGFKLSKKDHDLVTEYLDETGKFLFYQMSLADQRHSLAVAREILANACYQKDVNKPVLMQGALLHDIGKVAGELNFVNRLVAGMLKRISPRLLAKHALSKRQGWWSIRYGYYVEMVHPARGAYMARIFGIDPLVVELILEHQDPSKESDSVELSWLQYADNKH